MTGATRTRTAALSTAEDSRPASSGGWALPLVVLVAGMFMSVLDTSIVNVAIPRIHTEFGGTTNNVQWVVTGYTLTLGVIVPITAWLGDRFGLSRVYNLALLAFATGSALCGLAWNLHSLVAFRIIQAIPGGILPVITLSILLRIVPRERLGAAMGVYGLGIVVAPGVGPILGGYLVEYMNWRLIFYINAPIGILGALAAALVLPRVPRVAGRRFDALGFLTITAGLFALLLATSEGESWGWDSYQILGLITYGVLSLALFVVIELQVTNPLLDMHIFRYWAFTKSLLLIAVLMFVMYGVVFYIPQFLQVQGWGALDAGLTLLPQALVMAVLMPIAGRVYDRIGPRWPTVIGLTIVAAGSYLLHTITLSAPREHVMWLMVVLGIGLGIAFMPIFTGGVAVIPLTSSNAASTLNNVVQRVSGALGLAVFTAILTTQQAQQMAERAGLAPATTPTPHIGDPSTPDGVGTYSLDQQTHLPAFFGTTNNLFLIAAVLSILGALGALLSRSRSSPAAPSGLSAPAMETSTQAPVNGGLVKDQVIERDLLAATTMHEGNPIRLSTELDTSQTQAATVQAPTVQAATVQAEWDHTDERLQATAGELATAGSQIDELREQVATLRQDATDLAAAWTELAAQLAAEQEQVGQQRRRAEAAEQQLIQTASHIEHLSTELTTTQEQVQRWQAQAAEHRAKREPTAVKTARANSQRPKLGPRQVELARQMYDELDKDGKRRYTIQQIADAFGVTGPTISRHFRKTTSP